MQALAILCILLTWSFYALICVGLGAWLPRTKSANPDPADFLLAGLATLLALLQLWHFFAPINVIPYITLILLGIVLSSTVLGKSTFLSLLNTPRWAAITFALIALWLANHATGPNAEYDAGLYHLQAIKWTENFRIVPGLANLHMRFGFSSTLTLLAAFLDQGLWQGNASHIENGFLLAALAAMILRAATRTLNATTDLADRLLLFTAPLLTDWALDIQASSYSTDIGAAVLTVIAAYYFLRTFAPESRERNGLLTTLLAASAIAAKGSTLFLCAPMIAITLILLRKHSLRPAIAAALILLPWTVRETILTGYPLYPSAALSFPVDWRMPIQKVEWLRHTLLNWARWFSYDDTQGHTWIPTWLHERLLTANNLCKCLLPALIALPAILIALFRRRLAARSSGSSSPPHPRRKRLVPLHPRPALRFPTPHTPPGRPPRRAPHAPPRHHHRRHSRNPPPPHRPPLLDPLRTRRPLPPHANERNKSPHHPHRPHGQHPRSSARRHLRRPRLERPAPRRPLQRNRPRRSDHSAAPAPHSPASAKWLHKIAAALNTPAI